MMSMPVDGGVILSGREASKKHLPAASAKIMICFTDSPMGGGPNVALVSSKTTASAADPLKDTIFNKFSLSFLSVLGCIF